MKNRTLWILWLGLYVICALLSIVANPQGIVYAVLLLVGMAFFVPPIMLVLRGFREKNKKLLRQIRNLIPLYIMRLAFFRDNSRAANTRFPMKASPQLCL